MCAALRVRVTSDAALSQISSQISTNLHCFALHLQLQFYDFYVSFSSELWLLPSGSSEGLNATSTTSH